MQKSIKKSYGNSGANSDDFKRWIRVSKEQQKYYDRLIDRYGNATAGKVDKALIKEAERFLDQSFINADYSDVYINGKWRNYQLDLNKKR